VNQDRAPEVRRPAPVLDVLDTVNDQVRPRLPDGDAGELARVHAAVTPHCTPRLAGALALGTLGWEYPPRS
jgi:hypothetical protein